MSLSTQQSAGLGEHSPSLALHRSIDLLMGDVDSLTDRTQTVQNKSMWAYERVPREAVRASVQMNLETVRDFLLGSARLGERDFKSLESRMAQRVGQGVPIQDMIQGARTSIRIIDDRLTEIASAQGVTAGELLDATRLLWDLGDGLSAHLADLHQRTRIDDAVRESHRRSEFVRALLADELNGTDRLVRISAYGLDPDACYYAIKAYPADGASTEDLRRELETVRSGALSSVIGVNGDACFGVVPSLPEISTASSVAAGPSMILDEISKSFDIAVRIFAWMERRSETGLRQLDDVSWRLATEREVLIGELLRDRYLTPLDAHGDFGQLVKDSLAAYLQHDKHIANAARSLIVHPNTLRYRLAKYQEITGVDLESVPAIIELAWALESSRGAKRL